MDISNASFSDVRKMLIQTVVDLREQKMPAATGTAIAANFKELNNNIQVEINATKLSLQTEGRAHSFGQVVKMGQRLITGASE